MKKVVSLLLAACLLCGALAGCGGNKTSSFETLGVTYNDGSKATIDMSKDEIRKSMGENYSNDSEENFVIDTWSKGRFLTVDYIDEKLNTIYCGSLSNSSEKWISSVGIELGESFASVKEKLCEPAESISSEDDENRIIHTYIFKRIDGRYDLQKNPYKTIDEFYSNVYLKDSDSAYFYFSVITENDKTEAVMIKVLG